MGAVVTVHDDLVTLRLIGLTYEEQAALARVEAEVARLEQALANGDRLLTQAGRQLETAEAVRRGIQWNDRGLSLPALDALEARVADAYAYRQRAEAAEAKVALLTRERDAVTSECERLCDENDRMAADNARLRDGLRKIAVCFTAVQAVEIARALLADQDGAA